jgi:hypothetical protein
MKLLKKWWTGQQLTCRECGQEFELEAGDTPQNGFLAGGPYFSQVNCPCCCAPVNVRVPYGAEVPRTKEARDAAHD